MGIPKFLRYALQKTVNHLDMRREERGCVAVVQLSIQDIIIMKGVENIKKLLLLSPKLILREAYQCRYYC